MSPSKDRRKQRRCEKIRNDRLSKLTDAEKKAKKVFDELNLKYEEQYPIFTKNSFILVDFYLPDKKVAVEIDGISHDHRRKTWQSYNRWREKVIQKFGATLWRFRNEEVLERTESFKENVLKKM